MGLHVEGSGTGDRRRPGIGEFLHIGGTYGPTLWIGVVSDAPMPQEEAVRL